MRSALVRAISIACLFCGLGLLSACNPDDLETSVDQEQTVFTLQDVLGGETDARFQRADDPRAFSFPVDHGLHAGFRNEWWYLTGNLFTEQGRRFGYQLTFFYTALAPPGELDSQSLWDSERMWMAHLAITDVQQGEHHAVERFTRENPLLAGGRSSRIWLEDWELTHDQDADLWQLHAVDQAEGMGVGSLLLRPLKPPVLQGQQGLSRKSPEPGNASYYYSLTRLFTEGEIEVEGERFQVSGLSWLDREWSTSALAPDQSGWNWFSLQTQSASHAAMRA